MDYQVLKTELTTDPLGRGYAGMDDEAAANSLNLQDRKIDNGTVDGGSIVAAITRIDFIGLNSKDESWLRMIVTATNINVTNNFRKELLGLFAAGSDSRKALVDVLKKMGSRSEELGLGRAVTPSDVAKARRI